MLTTRKLGKQGLEVSTLGLGCMGMSQSYGVPDDVESIATLHRAVELVRFEAARHGVPVTDCELVGLVPLEALEELQTKCAADVGRVLSGEKAVYPISA